jgi:hypothetical protein
MSAGTSSAALHGRGSEVGHDSEAFRVLIVLCMGTVAAAQLPLTALPPDVARLPEAIRTLHWQSIDRNTVSPLDRRIGIFIKGATMRSRIVLGLALAAGGVVSGCTSYYQVSDPETNRVYYTEKLDRRDSGTVRFKDGRNGEEVTLPSSAIKEIPKEQYEVATTAPPTTAPIAAPTTAP